MKKIFILLIISLLLISNVLAATLTRIIPSTVQPNQQFTVTYATSGAPSTKWFVAWEDTITGGCTPAIYRNFMASESGGQSTMSHLFTAPSSGTCTFNGFYQFTSEQKTDFPSSTINVGGTCTPSCSGKVCGDNGCGGSCGTCSSGYTCSNGQCVTSSQKIKFSKRYQEGNFVLFDILIGNIWVDVYENFNFVKNKISGIFKFRTLKIIKCQLSNFKIENGEVISQDDFNINGTGQLSCTIPVNIQITRNEIIGTYKNKEVFKLNEIK